MKTRPLVLAALSGLAASLAAGAAPARDELIAIKLAPEDIVIIGPDKSVTRQQFDIELGAIGIVVHKERFALAAPNCQHDVIVRTPDIDKANAAAELAKRWKLFQQVQAALEKNKPIELKLLTRPYLKAGADGKFELPNCSAFFQLR